MAVKESGLRLAPPTRAPSISSWPRGAGGIVGLDAAAVEDAHLRGDVGAEQLGDFSADDLVRVGGHLGRGGFAGADGPDGLIGNDDGRGHFGGDAGERSGDLGLENLFGFAGFALGEDFADADDGNQAVLERGVELLVDDFVGLGEVLAALGVADERMRAADGLELADGGFAGVGAFFGKVDVLRADGDVRSLGGFNDGGQQDGRGEQGDLVAGVAGNQGQEGIDKSLGFGGRFVHLPISGNECFTGHFSGLLGLILADGPGGAG